MYDKFRKAFKVSVPLVAVSSPDPGLFVAMATGCLPPKTTVFGTEEAATAIVVWDAVRGLTLPPGASSEVAMRALARAAGMEPGDLIHPHIVLQFAWKLPAGSVLIMHNLDRYFDRADIQQGVWNLRDEFKINRRMLAMVGVSVRLPTSLRGDVLELTEPLPSLDEIQTHLGATLDGTTDDLSTAAKACQGFSLFGAEQALLMNVNVDREIDVAGIWADKCARINGVPGLKVATGAPYSSIAGISQIKKFVGQLMSGSRKPNVVVWVDEFEKALGGAKQDTSGVTQDQVAQLLHWMESTKAGGLILAGDPGTAKSAFAQATGAEFGVPTVRLDLGGMKASLVGDSERRIREALAMLDAVSDGQTLWLATVNSIDHIPPELRRRFRYGTWYFGLPNRSEREAIWSLYCSKWSLDTSEAVDLFSREWTGAEIETCCDLANQTGLSLLECSEFIAPVSGDPKGRAAMDALKTMADGAFLNASAPGVYSKGEEGRPRINRRPGQRSVGL